MRRCSALLLRLLALLIGLAAVGGPLTSTALAGPLVADLTGVHTALDGEPHLRITSAPPELWPGHRAELQVRITSAPDSTSAVRVVSLAASVGAASHRCGPENVSTTRYAWTPRSATYTVAPGQTVVVPLTITMVETGQDQNACQGAVFPLRFAARTERIS
jgi:hypothetical protein